MPKPTRLHDKGKPISIQKANVPELTEGSTEVDHESAVRQFQLELCWCIQQLERALTSKKGTDKKKVAEVLKFIALTTCKVQDTWKTLQVLKNNNQPIVRKRQLMRTYFGDYRAKMLAEEKKLVKMASKMKISEKPVKPKATFLRKSVFQTTGDSSFRFNFDVTLEAVDNDNHKVTNNDAEAGNTEITNSNTQCPKDGNINCTDGNTVTDSVAEASDMVTESYDMVTESYDMVAEASDIVAMTSDMLSEFSDMIAESSEIVVESSDMVAESTDMIAV
ncbi:hypothetical protein NE865_09097 [Phthorimaea operculella]|nr:hypothetical protein NE865_09097 [Phthorimaea operculella]